jgi:hypothetical protein
MVNRLPIEGTDKYWTAYAGVKTSTTAAFAGKMILNARDALQASGDQLHGGQRDRGRLPRRVLRGQRPRHPQTKKVVPVRTRRR